MRDHGSIPCTYKSVYKRKILWKAWGHIKTNAKRSSSSDTRREIDEYSANIDTNILSLQQRLIRNSFVFRPAMGAPVLKKDKRNYRPIVISPVENKIVQRAILEVISCAPAIRPHFAREVSFGAIPESGVADAIGAAMRAIREGGKYYCRSDIKKFFDHIKKEVVNRKFRRLIDDDRLYDIFLSAIKVELSNMAELGKRRDIFPIYELGVAQGNCLSPLVANVVLSKFDKAMNSGAISCFRYVDDFLIIAPTESDCRKAFENGVSQLSEIGLEAYNPYTGDDKAAVGRIRSGFEFLGIKYDPGYLSPSKATRKRLKAKVNKCLLDSLEGIQKGLSDKRADLRRFSYARTVYVISNIISGWGGQYVFCNNKQIFNQLDDWVDRRLLEYGRRVKTLVREREESGDAHASRRIFGVTILEEMDLDLRVERLSHEDIGK